MRSRLAVLALIATFAGPAQALCLLGCDAEITGVEATARLADLLGAPLPPGAKVLGLVEGGFQDAYLQARVSVSEPEFGQLLALMGVKRSDLSATTTPDLGPPAPAWFDPRVSEDLRSAIGDIPSFAYVTIVVAPEPDDRYSMWIWAFRT